MTVFAIGEWKTNADLIEDIAKLGYLKKEWLTLDTTYGEGKWWTKWKPDALVGCDIDPAKSPLGYSVDFRRLPFHDGTFEAVTYDPPYKLNGATTVEKDKPYGVHVEATRDERLSLILDGMSEAARVLIADGYLLVKVQDQVNGGKVRWQSDLCSEHAKSVNLEKVDLFLFRSYRPQPANRRQLTARRNYSSLIVFKKGKS